MKNRKATIKVLQEQPNTVVQGTSKQTSEYPSVKAAWESVERDYHIDLNCPSLKVIDLDGCPLIIQHWGSIGAECMCGAANQARILRHQDTESRRSFSDLIQGPTPYIRFYGTDWSGRRFSNLLQDPKRGVKALGGTFITGRAVNIYGDDIDPKCITRVMIDETTITSEKEFRMSFKYGWLEKVD